MLTGVRAVRKIKWPWPSSLILLLTATEENSLSFLLAVLCAGEEKRDVTAGNSTCGRQAARRSRASPNAPAGGVLGPLVVRAREISKGKRRNLRRNTPIWQLLGLANDWQQLRGPRTGTEQTTEISRWDPTGAPARAAASLVKCALFNGSQWVI